MMSSESTLGSKLTYPRGQKVHVNVEYVTSSNRKVTRTLGVTQIVATSLPVAVNVQDFFRGTRCAIEAVTFIIVTRTWIF